jgi:signal transduction histidine kinase/uncharacterized protein YoaH (UPF0181 family)
MRDPPRAGTVIANSKGDLKERRERTLEQAARRRIATLAAQGVQARELFAVVAEEVGRVVDAPCVGVARFEPDATATVCGTFPPQGPLFRNGARVSVESADVLGLVRDRAEPARVENYDELEGEIADAVRRSGLRSSVGVPIVIAGRVWGSVVVCNTELLPESTEARLAEFTELLATVIANAEARGALRQLADEQEALRRVATLVAQDAAPAEIFAAVSAEVDRVFGLDPAAFDVAVVGRFEPGPELVVVGLSKSVEAVSLGSRWPPDELFAPAHVLRTGRSARIRADDLVSAGGEVAEFLRQHGYLSQVASPIVVDGRLWGAMSVNARNEFPPDTEDRLERFTELVATAIANAESHEAAAELAGEQMALRRVATLVARGVSPKEVFAAVAEEVGRLLVVSRAYVTRYESGDNGMLVAGWSAAAADVPVGLRFEVAEGGVAAQVRRTGLPARVDAYAPGPAADTAKAMGIESAVAAPISVEGSLWGLVIVGSTAAAPPPPGTEQRLAGFTELVATAIGNAQAREELRRIADEQATLRRVATLVAHDAPPCKVFDVVALEVGKLLDADVTVVGRYDGDGAVTATGSWSASPGGVPVGTRAMRGGRNVLTLVAETERPARIDGYDDASGEPAEIARRHGWRSSIAAPIIVEGRLWGVMMVATQRPEPFPVGAEERLSAFTDLVATAIANAETRSALAASRRRIVAAADEARRRIERDLHDGIQQRLIALSFRARAMTRRPPDELPDIAAELSEGLKEVSDELREVSRGIHPTILTEAGLGPALRALARRSNVPIHVEVTLDEPLPAPVEAAAYYIASEALTNVTKHAHANIVELSATHDNDALTLQVRDDGIGGADNARGSGILGLTDRVEALGGTITITSPPHHGTTLIARLPIAT